MARYKTPNRNSLLLSVVRSEQIMPGNFAFALDWLVDNELDLSALDARFMNDEVRASAYDPRVMLKIVLLAYSQGLVSSHAIEQAFARNVQFIASAQTAMGTNSRMLAGAAKDLPTFFASVASVAQQKFVPHTGAVIGAVGASGGTGDDDEKICMEGAEVMGLAHA